MTAVVFVPLALNQVRFYVALARLLRERGIPSGFISLHEPSLSLIARVGFPVVNLFALTPRRLDPLPAEVQRLAERYGITNINRLISHERVTYEIRDSGYLLSKLAAYLLASERALTRLSDILGGSLEVVQELGGFLSVLATFYVARAHGFDVTLIEPSFFRGRVFFLKNTIAAMPIRPSGRAVAPEVRAYLDETIAQQRIVVPAKDVHHFRSPWRKLLSGYNLRRFLQKAGEKYLLGQREEFSYLRTQMRLHFRSALNERRLRRLYSPLPQDRKFLYYPLHVATDVALTLRAPEYLDQCALLDYLARNVPVTYLLVAKEHPAMVGGIDYVRVRDLLRRYDNVRLLPPDLNNLEVIRRASAIVTVNSKSGAEAILLNRPVLALGDSFYRASGLVLTATLSDVPDVLQRIVTMPPRGQREIEAFFQGVWESSYPGELYDTDEANCERFVESLVAHLRGVPSATDSAFLPSAGLLWP